MNAKELASLAINVYGAMQKQEEFEQLLELVLKASHETILEIGSGHGGTLWAWSHLPKNKTVISVDLPGGDFGGGLTAHDKEVIENWMDPEKNTFLAAMDSHDSNTLKEVEETLKTLTKPTLNVPMSDKWNDNRNAEVSNPYHGRVDILFIDGDHTYDGVKKDFEMYSPLVRPGGLICFHDVLDHSQTAPTCMVKEFWDAIKANYPFIEFTSDPKTWGGIGVLQW